MWSRRNFLRASGGLGTTATAFALGASGLEGVAAAAAGLAGQSAEEVARNEFIDGKEYLQLYDQKFVDGILFIGANSRHRFVSELTDGSRPFLMGILWQRSASHSFW